MIAPDQIVAYLAPRVQSYRDMGLLYGETSFTSPDADNERTKTAFSMFLTVLHGMGCMPVSIMREETTVQRAIVTPGAQDPSVGATRYKIIFHILQEESNGLDTVVQ